MVVNVIRPGVGTVDKELLEQYSQVGVGSPKETMTKSLEKLTGLSRDEISTVFDDLPSGKVETPTIGKIFKNLLLVLVSENLFVSAAETQLLPMPVSVHDADVASSVDGVFDCQLVGDFASHDGVR